MIASICIKEGDPLSHMAIRPPDEDFVAIQEIRAAAQRTLPSPVWEFLESGAGTESTLRANREAFGRWVIRPRPMSGVCDPDTSATIMGIPLALPVFTAPFGGDALFAPEGHLAVARANAACGTGSIVPEVGSFSWQEVRAAAPSAVRIAQLHPWDSFDHAAARIKDAGYDVLCVTIDCPQPGFRVRSAMSRFHPEHRVWRGNATAPPGTPTANDMFTRGVSAAAPAWSWEQLARATERAGLPWIAKGIVTGEAAAAALAAGASGIIVSNHGGRQVDPAPASLDALPEVIGAVAGRVPVLLDSGVRSGADMLLALARGADAVVIGRLTAYGLAAGGEAGVRRVIELLREELRTLMILAGLPDLKSVTPDLIAPREDR
jgi:isopentenyl diphosphate isomerase/L-lactate dehydrogenase-like FMN-dependent dehydrogenase